VKRREALRQIGWGLSGSAVMPSLLAACGPKDPGPEIVYSGKVAIVGAGASGLYVADILHSKGVKVELFEALEQIGGRVRSLRNQPVEKYPYAPAMSSDFPIELGAQTIIGSDSVFGKIFTDYRLPTVEFPTSGNVYVMDNIPKTSIQWGNDADFLAAKNFRLNVRNQAGSAQTVQQAASATVNQRALAIVNSEIGNFYGSSNEVMGVGAIGEQEALAPTDGKIIGLTANPFQDILISRFNTVQQFVHLNTPIAAIDYGASPIVLTAKDGTVYNADKVIVTVPLGILKSGSMSFTPGLPGDFTSALQKFAMGASLRLVIEFKKNFWGEDVSYIRGSSNVPEYFSAGAGRGKTNATFSITVNGAKAVQYGALNDEALLDTVLADIDAIYGGQGTQFIRQDVNTLKSLYIKQDWTKQPYILGGYAYPLAGAKNANRASLGQAISGKLFFAGEATDTTGQAGMLNGALASAERAAIDVINAIKAEG
jgi:monoamine oxidase